MFRIIMHANKDTSEKRCFILDVLYNPGKVIVKIQKKGSDGKFETVGYISPDFLRLYSSAAAADNTFSDIVAVSAEFRPTYLFYGREGQQMLTLSNNKKIINQIKEIEWMDSQREAIIKELQESDIKCPTLREYQKAYKRLHISCR